MPDRRVQRDMVRPTYSRRAETRRRPRLPKLQVGWIRLAVYAALVLALVVLVARSTTITSVKITGNRDLTAQHLNRLVHDDLSRQWFGQSLILVNTSALASSLEQAEPGVK